MGCYGENGDILCQGEWSMFCCFHELLRVWLCVRENPDPARRDQLLTLTDTLQLLHISTAIYCLIALPLKLAIILQIRRIVLPRRTSQSASRLLYRWMIDFFITLNAVFYLSLFIFQFLACRPLARAWDPRVEGYCVPHRMSVHIVSASINTASDLITVLLPQPVIWSLKMARRRKWALSAVFCVGAL